MSKVGGGVGEGGRNFGQCQKFVSFYIQDFLDKTDLIYIFLLIFFNIAVTAYDHGGTLVGAYFEYCVTPCQAPYVAS